MFGTIPFEDLLRILTLRGGFNSTTVVIGSTLFGFASGLVGVFAMLRKRSLTSDALAHATLPGIVAAFLIARAFGGDQRSLPLLLIGAAAASAVAAVCLHSLARVRRVHEDAAIAIVLSVFFGIGVVGLSYIQSNAAAGSAGLDAFLFGQAATMLPRDVAVMAAVAGLSVAAAVLLRKELVLLCFNAGFARAAGWPVRAIDLVLLGLIVAVTVSGLQAVGVVLVVAMLIVPPVTARLWTDRVAPLLAGSAGLGAASGAIGAAVSAVLPNKPAGAVIVLTAGGFFVLSLLFAPSRGAAAGVVRRLRLRVRIARDHVLETAWERGERAITAGSLRATARQRGWLPLFAAAVRVAVVLGGYARWSSIGGMRLTPAGIERGARVSRNHALWEQYLISHADVAPSHVDWSVDQVEHVLSPDLIAELERRLSSRVPAAPRAQGAGP